jgi:hypothetical protein
VPGKNFRHYLKVDANPEVEVLRLWDADGGSYEFKIPATGAGISELATELSVLRALRPHAESLPFAIPEQIGQTQDSDGTRAAVLTLLGGNSPDLSRLAPGGFSKTMALALAAIHQIPVASVSDAGLPEYDSTALLHVKVAELDRIAATGRIPATLLNRWERALEDIGLFRFHATVTHGAINSETVLVNDQQVVGITGWSSIAIADPAEDFRWLAGGALPSTFEDALIHYRAAKPNADENLAQRAVLYSELELGSWLLHCLETGDAEQIKQAEDMLSDLRDNLEAGNIKDLAATSFVGLAAAATIIPSATVPNPIVEEPHAAQEEPHHLEPSDQTSDSSDPVTEETSLDELF